MSYKILSILTNGCTSIVSCYEPLKQTLWLPSCLPAPLSCPSLMAAPSLLLPHLCNAVPLRLHSVLSLHLHSQATSAGELCAVCLAFFFFFFLFPLPFLLEERFVCWPLAWGGTGMQCMPRPRSISCCCSPLRRHGSSTSSSEMRQLPKRLDFYGGGKSPIFLTVNLCGVTVLEICWFRGMCVLFIGCCGRER